MSHFEVANQGVHITDFTMSCLKWDAMYPPKLTINVPNKKYLLFNPRSSNVFNFLLFHEI